MKGIVKTCPLCSSLHPRTSVKHQHISTSLLVDDYDDLIGSSLDYDDDDVDGVNTDGVHVIPWAHPMAPNAGAR